MKAGLVIIGTELTRGIIQDRHTILVSKALTGLGVHFSESIIVPDDGTIRGTLKFLLGSCDVIIVTGGLGPTTDDMTRSVIAEAAGVKLVKNESAWSDLVARIGEERAHGANEKQAYIPEGFTLLKNPNGTAPGFFGQVGNTLLFALPGPPREMEPMFNGSVIQLLRARLGKAEAERDEYTTLLLSEAKLEELTRAADSSLDWGTRFQDYKVSLYVSGGDRERRNSAISRLRATIGSDRLLDGNRDALLDLIELLKKREATISLAESCTGGLAASLLTSQSGASTYFIGSVTSYATRIKRDVLKVSQSTIDSYGVVSPECAKEMADGVRKLLKSDYAFSITGVAGPDKQEGKEVGTVSIGLSSEKESRAVSITFPPYGRESNRRRASTAAFILTKLFIEGKDIESIVKEWTLF